MKVNIHDLLNNWSSFVTVISKWAYCIRQTVHYCCN